MPSSSLWLVRPLLIGALALGLQTVVAGFASAASNDLSTSNPRDDQPFAAATADPATSFETGIRNQRLSSEQALELIRRAAESNYGPAQEALARLYIGDDGISAARISAPRNYDTALYWAMRHVQNEEGDVGGRQRALSMGLLAWLYFYGKVDGGPSYSLARDWAQKSAKDSRYARQVLWKLYEEGLGVEKDPLQAEYWKFRFESPSSPYALIVGKGDWPLEKKLLLSAAVFTGRTERISVLRVSQCGDRFQNWLEADIAVQDVLTSQAMSPTRGQRIKVIVAFSDAHRDNVEQDFLGKTLVYPVSLQPQVPNNASSTTYYGLIGNAGRPSPLSIDRLPYIKKTLARIRDLGLDRLY